MVHTAMQFPENFFSETKKIDPAGGNTILNTFFSPNFISNDIVLGYEALVRHDREVLATRPAYLQKYVLSLLTILAPFKDCAKPNFGRIDDRKQKHEESKHRGLLTTKQSSEGGRLTTKKKSLMINMKTMAVVSNIIHS